MIADYRVIDIMMQEGKTVVLVECKHGNELKTDLTQMNDYFTYAKVQKSSGKEIKIRLFIGNDITGDGAKEYVKHAIALHEQTEVPLEIYIKGELKSINEVKQMVEG